MQVDERMNKPARLGNTDVYVMTVPGTVSRHDAGTLKKQWDDVMPGTKLIILGEGITVEAAPDLDAAWMEAEAALPQGWDHIAVRRERSAFKDDYVYVATAGRFGELTGAGCWSWPGEHTTPSAALRALAQRLNDHPRQ